jgi:hypothetical protein
MSRSALLCLSLSLLPDDPVCKAEANRTDERAVGRTGQDRIAAAVCCAVWSVNGYTYVYILSRLYGHGIWSTPHSGARTCSAAAITKSLPTTAGGPPGSCQCRREEREPSAHRPACAVRFCTATVRRPSVRQETQRRRRLAGSAAAGPEQLLLLRAARAASAQPAWLS